MTSCLLSLLENVVEAILDAFLASLDGLHRASSSKEKLVLFGTNLIDHGLLFIKVPSIDIDKFINTLAHSIGQEKLAAQAVALIEFGPVAHELPHDLDEPTLCVSILDLELVPLLFLLC